MLKMGVADEVGVVKAQLTTIAEFGSPRPPSLAAQALPSLDSGLKLRMEALTGAGGKNLTSDY